MSVQSKLKGWLVTSAYWDAGTGEDSDRESDHWQGIISSTETLNRQVHLADGPGHTQVGIKCASHRERPSEDTAYGWLSGMRMSSSFGHQNMGGEDGSGLPSDASFWVQMPTLVSGDNCGNEFAVPQAP